MENKELITKGKEFHVVEYAGNFQLQRSPFYEDYIDLFDSDDVGYDVAKANASLICEAFNVFNETNLTPLEMKERIEELEKMIKSDSVYTILRFGVKSPSRSGMDNCEDSEYWDLYNTSIELRKPVTPH